MAKRAKGTGTLRKRKDGRWEGRLYLGKDENGKNKYKTVTSMKKSECQRKLDTIIEENEKRKRNEEHRYGDCANPTVEEWSKIYIVVLPFAPNSIRFCVYSVLISLM